MEEQLKRLLKTLAEWVIYFISIWRMNSNFLQKAIRIASSPSGIFNKIPSKHLLVFKTSWGRLQDMSWRRLQHVFSVTILRLPRRLEDVFKTSRKMSWRHLQDVLEDQKLLRWRHLQDVLKTCLEDVLKTCLEDVLKTYLEDVFKTSRRQTKFLLVITVSNKSKCVANKSLFHKLYLRKGESKCVT